MAGATTVSKSSARRDGRTVASKIRINGKFESMTSSFIEMLHTDGPAPDRSEKMGLYGWLIGSWEMDAVVHVDDGTVHKGPGEIHFGWVLEGRAIQDVWILPNVFHGTTLRVYEPGIDAWHILWSDPLRQYYT